MTIWEAAQKILNNSGIPLSAKDIYSKIIDNDYYRFKTSTPIDVVRSQLCRRCDNLEWAMSSSKRYFTRYSDGRFGLLLWKHEKQHVEVVQKENSHLSCLKELKIVHLNYLEAFKEHLLSELRALNSYDFEVFSKNFLSAYGFSDVKVTSKTRDGGIDGYGKLRSGLTKLNVAFECKQWANKVGVVQVRQFKGALQQHHQYGIYFTTSNFTKDAVKLAQENYPVPIILINGTSLVDFMIEKGIGVKEVVLSQYDYDLDTLLSD